jgi:pilus assembly protein CpaB
MIASIFFWTATPSVTENNEKVFSITRQIESGVKIIAVDQNYSVDDADKPQLASTIVVAVTAEQAASLALAQAQGQLSMTLIGVDETDSMNAEIVEVSQHRLLGISRDEAESAVCHIKSRRGADVVMTEIPCTN